MIAHVARTWHTWLGPLVADLPLFDVVIEELRPQIDALM